MSTERQTDMGDYILVETGEPTVENPTAWFSSRADWKPGSTGANQQTIRDQAQAAFAANRAFLAIGSPTNAQTLAQVKALTNQMNKLGRLIFQEFDGTD